jgi:hypothetical protein
MRLFKVYRIEFSKSQDKLLAQEDNLQKTNKLDISHTESERVITMKDISSQGDNFNELKKAINASI